MQKKTEDLSKRPKKILKKFCVKGLFKEGCISTRVCEIRVCADKSLCR